MIIKIDKLKKALFTFTVSICILGALLLNNYLSNIQPVSSKIAVKLPIVMYHQILKDSKMWGKYVISPNDFEMDLVYLLNEGYTTIDVQDLIDYVYNGKSLPEKPIMITFDDGYLTIKEYILPILEKYNCKAVVSIVGEFTDRFTKNVDRKLSYAHLNWDDINELVNSKYIEIQNHSYDMHKVGNRRGIAKKIGENYEEYKKVLNNDILYLQNLIKKNTGYTPYAFTYPFGEMSKDSISILKDMGFLVTFSCNEGINILTGDKEELYQLKRYNRPYNINREKFFGKFE